MSRCQETNSGDWAWLSAQSDVKGTGDAPGVGALKQDLDLVVGQSEMVTENQPGPTEDASWPPEGVAWDEDPEGRGDPGKYLIHVTDSVFFSSLPSPLDLSE